MIDDGSIDHSLEMCEKLSRTDDRIKVYHQENKGASTARNYGLDIAAGEFVYFLDSDDAIHPLLFKEMMRQLKEHHMEMVFCNVARVNNRQLDVALAGTSVQEHRWETTARKVCGGRKV